MEARASRVTMAINNRGVKDVRGTSWIAMDNGPPAIYRWMMRGRRSGCLDGAVGRGLGYERLTWSDGRMKLNGMNEDGPGKA